MLLAIDTATDILSLAVHDGEMLLAESTLMVGRNHSALLAPLIEQAMAQSGVDKDDLTALTACIGPGSYTGLRIGVALAKGMAAVRDLPLVPVNTLDIIAAAQDRASESATLIVTVPAGRQRLIWASYRNAGAGWMRINEARLGSWDDLFENCQDPCALTGEITAAGLQRTREAIDAGKPIKLVVAAKRLRRAGFLAEIAWERLQRDGGDAYPADRVKPIYLKSPR